METFKAVHTRIFGLRDENDLKISAMVPIGDLFNHDNPPDIEWKYQAMEDGRRGVFYHATQDISKGDSVNISYGNKANVDLLN